MTTCIAALFVDADGAYADLPGIDCWDEQRDARLYSGPHPVIAHPPCSSWCQLAHINQKRYGYRVGDDGGCFRHALRCVRDYGGVLEHPANSYAWPHFQLQRPLPWSWQRGLDLAWTTEVAQVAYGHRAIKKTWLYAVCESPPLLDWRQYQPTAQVSWCANHGDSSLPRIGKKAAAATPAQFRDLLISIARSVRNATVF